MINSTKLETFRKKYDPHYTLIKSHITLIFPINDTLISRKSLSDHIKSIVNNWKPFNIELRGFTKSWDHWLFLMVKNGNKEMIQLHDELYQGILSPYLRNDLEYIPHISLGHFIKKSSQNNQRTSSDDLFDESLYKLALEEAENLNFIYQTKIKTVQLVQINEEFTQTTNLMEFLLNLQ
ncbi:MAG: 2'-5' RNA ligase family protein [Candidatus Lokiarchaeota archaeon]|nr:2'-5' RNA ligase family protein [Candidatus Lokiarchaeota archaeon]